MEVKELEKDFIGGAEVSGFKFHQIASSEYGFLYEVLVEDELCHYEVFLKKLVPLCLNFEERIYSETEFKEIYPKGKDFGTWAWTLTDYPSALNKFNTLKEYVTEHKS